MGIYEVRNSEFRKIIKGEDNKKKNRIFIGIMGLCLE
jgi:hypothetical protein